MSTPLREDALAIWRAGVAAVDSERLVAQNVRVDGNQLTICGHPFDLATLGRIAVVGTGKAGAGMAAAFERAIGDGVLREKLTGWVNVPADCVRPLERIQLHAARPAGVNEPTEEGVAGAERILDIVSGLAKRDLCVVLLSGGGSALLPAPVPEITLADKQRVTRLLMRGGATIDELNCVRKHLSRIKGGGLARAISAGTTIVLVISDVIGDPLETIASGPTVPDTTTAREALDILRRFVPDDGASNGDETVPPAVIRHLEREAAAEARAATRTLGASGSLPPRSEVHHHIIGNNATALDAAADEARRRGYTVHSLGSHNAGEARRVGEELADLCVSIRATHAPLAPPACVLSGGEPVVHLAATDRPRKGGRNQEVAVAALHALEGDGLRDIAILSGGTDGEDGPTNAAGGVVDAETLRLAREKRLDAAAFLAINDTYPFLDATHGLIRTGPTHTNVMDLRVALVSLPVDAS
ncbi:MAG: DUF4147 domain-containing protein [Planctomycetaceae bacterium]